MKRNEIKTHYNTIADTILKASVLKTRNDEDNGIGIRAFALGNNGWYDYLPNNRVKLILPQHLDEFKVHIQKMIKKGARTLYWTCNFFKPELRNETRYWKNAQEHDTRDFGSYKDTYAYSLYGDIDLITGDVENKEDKYALEKFAQFFSDKLKNLGIWNNLHFLFSGNGIYLYLSHNLFKKIYDDYSSREYDEDDNFHTLLEYEIVRAWNKLLLDIQDECLSNYPELKGKVKIDTISNSKRQVKTIFSIHKKKPYAVIPLNKENIQIDLEEARIPISKEVIKKTEKEIEVAKEGDPSELPAFVDAVREFIEEIKYEKKREQTWEVKEILNLKFDEKNFDKLPPCLLNCLQWSRDDFKKGGPTRAVAFISSMAKLYGIQREDAWRLYVKRAKELNVPINNLFDSNYSVMKPASCKTMQSKTSSAYPSKSMGDTGVCEPDEVCSFCSHPIHYTLIKLGRNEVNYGELKIKFLTDDYLEVSSKDKLTYANVDNLKDILKDSFKKTIQEIKEIEQRVVLFTDKYLNNLKNNFEENKNDFKQSNKLTDLDILEYLNNSGEFFVDQNFNFLYKQQNSFQCIDIENIFFEGIVRDYYRQQTSSIIPITKLKSIINEAKTYALKKKIKTSNRISEHQKNIYYDLGNDAVVEITKKGWNLAKKQNRFIYFMNYGHKTHQVQPIYEENWDVDQWLQQVFNFKNILDLKLFKIYLVSCFIPNIAHPLLSLHGSEGSGKTKTLEFLKRIVDPSVITTTALSSDVRDRNLNLFQNYLVCFDNLSQLDNYKTISEVSDQLARAITGQGWMERKLFTNKEVELYSGKTIVALNGINNLIKTPDLADRTLSFELERIHNPFSETILNEIFEDGLPKLLGWIFTQLSELLKRNPSNNENLPRMSDFGNFGAEIAEITGTFKNKQEFLIAFKQKVLGLKMDLVGEDDLINLIAGFIEEADWCGTSTELLKKLKIFAETNDTDISYIKTSAVLTKKLNKFKVILKEMDIEYSYIRTAKKKIICLKKITSLPKTEKSKPNTGDGNDGNDGSMTVAKPNTGDGNDGKLANNKKKQKNKKIKNKKIKNSKKNKNREFTVTPSPDSEDTQKPYRHLPSLPSPQYDLVYLLRSDPLVQLNIEFIHSIIKEYYNSIMEVVKETSNTTKEDKANRNNSSPSFSTGEGEEYELPFKKLGRNLLKKQVYIIELIEAGYSSEEAKAILEKALSENSVEEHNDGYIFAWFGANRR